MATFYHLFGSIGVHFIFYEEQLDMEMLDGISKRPPFVTTIGKSSRNSYSSYRIQAVCILDNLSFYGFWMFTAIFAERNSIDNLANPVDLVLRNTNLF